MTQPYTVRQSTGYQVRPSAALFHVLLVRADDLEIPVTRQVSVYSHKSWDRAQVVCDALNKGTLSRVVRAVNAERKARA